MRIDLPTLMIAGSFVAATGGAFLLLAWWQNRQAMPMLWWATANFAFAAGVPLTVRGPFIESPALVLGITLLNISPALIWASGRSSNGRRVDYVFIFAGAAIWLAAWAIPDMRAQPGALATLNQAMIAFYLLASANEFFNKRAEQVTARQPLVVLLTLHGFFFAYGAWESLQAGWATVAYSVGIWLDLVHFETLIFVVGTSIFAVAMMREQSELRQRIQARTDELTGLYNRRAFYRDGEAILRDTQDGGGRLSVILLDIDGFKSINDQFGHHQGDDVLRVFGRTVRETTRASDIVGRVGGEEFAIILPDTALPLAYDVAERVRAGFERESERLGAHEIRATLSAGVVESDGFAGLDTLVARADAALYRAKADGRNRVERFDAGRDAAARPLLGPGVATATAAA